MKRLPACGLHSAELPRGDRPETPRDEILAVVDGLGEQERAVLLVLARRLLQGQKAYGKLDLAHDGRDFVRERSFEIQDLLIYSAFEVLKRELA